MRWIEEISAIAARRVHPGPWASASIDSLTFKSSAKPGEVVCTSLARPPQIHLTLPLTRLPPCPPPADLRAVVTKSYNSSVEVWATATAEDRNAPISTPRVISDAFFSLVAIDPVSGRPLRGVLKGVRVREGTAAAEVASGAGRRREERLVDKRVLQRSVWKYANTRDGAGWVLTSRGITLQGIRLRDSMSSPKTSTRNAGLGTHH